MRNIFHNFTRLHVLILVLAIILVAAIAMAVIVSGTMVQITLNGEQTVTVEFGTQFEDPGAQANLHSNIFHNRELEVESSVQPQWNPQQLGTYTITYKSGYSFFRAAATRTIHIVDTQAPVIVLKYDANSFTLPGEVYQEEGFVAEDNYDGDITDKVERIAEKDFIRYRVTDSSGNTTEVTRAIKYGDLTAPTLTLQGDKTITINAGEKFQEPGFTATDNIDGDITAQVTVSKDHNTNIAGTYTITYTATDSFGNVTTATRTLIVKAVKQPQVVTPEGATIYLTFDDGPGQHTLRLLDILDKYEVKATFFVKGIAASAYFDDIVKRGHAIGMHSNTHDYGKIYASEEAFFADMKIVDDLIYEKTGVRTTLMRFPGGSSNAISKNYCKGIMTRLTKAVEDRGYQYFDWNVDSNDAGGAKTAEEVYQNVIKGCSGRKSSIVLQHDIHGFSVDAVERIIQWGLANGYKFSALSPNSPKAHHGVNN